MEPRAKVEPGSGKHSVYTHFPKDPNCDTCLKTKITRASCRRRPFKHATSDRNLLMPSRRRGFSATAESRQVAWARSNSAMTGFFDFDINGEEQGREKNRLVISRGRTQERNGILHNLTRPGWFFLTFRQAGGNLIVCLIREVQPIVRNPMVHTACTFWSHGAQGASACQWKPMTHGRPKNRSRPVRKAAASRSFLP